MEIISWYQWALLYLYDLSTIIFIVALILFSLLNKDKYLYISLFGFITYFIGNLTLNKANIATSNDFRNAESL